MKDLCLDAAQSIVKRIRLYCEDSSYVGVGPEVKVLTEALSILDNIIYASKEDEGGEKE